MDGQVWERQAGEPALWFRRFERFRLLGPGRSLLAVYNGEREKARPGASRRRSVPGAWNRAAQAWRWRERAAAWDADEAERERLEREAEERRLREQARQTRRSLLGAGHNLLARAMMVYMGTAAPVPDVQTVQRLIMAIEKFNADSRQEYGDLPVQALEHRGPDGGPVRVEVVYSTETPGIISGAAIDEAAEESGA